MPSPNRALGIGLLPLLLAQVLALGGTSAAAQVPAAAAAPVTAAAAPLSAAAAPGSAEAAPESARASVRLFPLIVSVEDPATRDDAAAYAEALGSSLEQKLKSAGYSVIQAEQGPSPDAGEPAQAADLAHGSGDAWAAVCALSLAEGRLSYRIAIYDSSDASLAAGDSFSVLAGLGALRTMDDSADSAVGRLADYRAGHAGTVRKAVSYRIAVICAAEGATVSVDSPGLKSGAPTGKIKNGKVLLPYYPFLQGSTLQITATTRVRERLSATVTLGALAPVIELKTRRPRFDILVGTGTGRLMGAGAELRAYLAPEWSFIFLEDRLYAGYDFQTGSSPVLHEESWDGLGCYLFFPPSSRFRMGLTAGLGFLLSVTTLPGSSKQVFFDLALLPVNLFGEYSLGKDLGIWMSLRSAYSLGFGSSGLLPRGWMANGAPALSLGMVWRRR